MGKTCLQGVRASTALGDGIMEWLNRHGRSGLEELWRDRKPNGGAGGYQDASWEFAGRKSKFLISLQS